MGHAVIEALTTRQRSVLRFYLDVLAKSSNVELYRSTWRGAVEGQQYAPRDHAIARIELPVKKGLPVQFYGTLGDMEAEGQSTASHEHQFMSLVDTVTEDVVAMLSHARAHHTSLAALDSDSSFLLDEDSPMRARGYTNVLVARADLFGPFQNRNSVVIDGWPMTLLSLLPLEPQEWQVKVERGTDALFDLFRATGRDLLSLKPVRS
jgi:hypothetical protein